MLVAGSLDKLQARLHRLDLSVIISGDIATVRTNSHWNQRSVTVRPDIANGCLRLSSDSQKERTIRTGIDAAAIAIISMMLDQE